MYFILFFYLSLQENMVHYSIILYFSVLRNIAELYSSVPKSRNIPGTDEHRATNVPGGLTNVKISYLWHPFPLPRASVAAPNVNHEHEKNRASICAALKPPITEQATTLRHHLPLVALASPCRPSHWLCPTQAECSSATATAPPATIAGHWPPMLFFFKFTLNLF
jgi:hypothetical protein